MAGKPKRMSQIKQLLQLHDQGKSIKFIARSLGISKNTVKAYLSKTASLPMDTQALLSMEDPILESKYHSGRSIKDFREINSKSFLLTSFDKVLKTEDGGFTWLEMYDGGGRIIQANSTETALLVLNEGYCPTDYVLGSDVLAFTRDGGNSWVKSDPASNLSWNFVGSQILKNGRQLFLIGSRLFDIQCVVGETDP